MKAWQRRLLERGADIACSMVMQPHPSPRQIARARIVAHRGNTGEARGARENTLAAFGRCAALGAFGIEIDLQWTRDGVPVVIHDADTARVFGHPGVAIGESGFDMLRARFPGIPTLEEVVSVHGGRLHLMIELKTETFAPRHLPKLLSVLAGLEPEADYHLLCLQPQAFGALAGIEPGARIVVAETNTRDVVRTMADYGLTRIAGHYLLINRSLRRRFSAAGVRYGVGMIPNARVLCRELALGSHWLFTNHAARLQRELDLLQSSQQAR